MGRCGSCHLWLALLQAAVLAVASLRCAPAHAAPRPARPSFERMVASGEAEYAAEAGDDASWRSKALRLMDDDDDDDSDASEGAAAAWRTDDRPASPSPAYLVGNVD